MITIEIPNGMLEDRFYTPNVQAVITGGWGVDAQGRAFYDPAGGNGYLQIEPNGVIEIVGGP